MNSLGAGAQVRRSHVKQTLTIGPGPVFLVNCLVFVRSGKKLYSKGSCVLACVFGCFDVSYVTPCRIL